MFSLLLWFHHALPLQYHDDGNEFLGWIITDDETWVNTHYPRNQAAISALASQWISLKDEIEAEQRVMCTVFWDRWGILLVDFLARGETVNVECYSNHCRNCVGPFKTSGTGCLVQVLSCRTITLDHTWLDGQHMSCKSSAGRC